MTDPSRESKIKETAYALWEREGRPNGRDLEHYFKAEVLVDGQPVPPNGSPKAATTSARKPRAASTTRKPSAKKAA
jgi:hypothetical protein